MSIAFSLDEMIKIAVGIEKQGTIFYDVMARSTKQPAARDLFIHLANAERQHMETFKKMAPEGNNSIVSDDEQHEYDDYLKALVSNAVFTDEMATGELATRINSDIEALDLGIRAEKDSILFYYHMREIMAPTLILLLDKIIKEEQTHINQLSEMKKRLA